METRAYSKLKALQSQTLETNQNKPSVSQIVTQKSSSKLIHSPPDKYLKTLPGQTLTKNPSECSSTHVIAPNAKIVHSPPESNQNNSLYDLSNTASAFNTSNRIQRTPPGQFEPSLIELNSPDESTSSATKFFVDLTPTMSEHNENGAEEMQENENRLNEASSINVRELNTMIQDAVRTSQDRLNQQMINMSQTINNLSQMMLDKETTNQTAPNTTNRQSFAEYVPPPRTQFPNSTPVKLQDWKINFDGNGSVSDFLFKLDTLQDRTICSNDHLLANFHIFLTGKAHDWYWLFTRQNPKAPYAMLKYAIKRQFGGLQSDHEVMLKISTKRQKSESFSDFLTEILSMNSRLSKPIEDPLLIEIIMKNVHTNLRYLLFSAQPQTIDDLRDLACRAESMIKESKFIGSSTSKTISEIESLDHEEVEEHLELDPQIEAIRINKYSKPDYSRIECWNCRGLGHSYIYCPNDGTRNLFCYKCGTANVNTLNCPKKHLNQKSGEKSFGDSRPLP